MKFRDLDGQFKDIVIKTGDTLPVGSVVEYEGSTPPAGWSKLSDGGSVIVSSEEPTTGEEVWLEKGENLIDKNLLIFGMELDGNGGTLARSNYYITPFIEIESNTIYTFKGAKSLKGADNYYKDYYDKDYNFISSNDFSTFTTPSNAKYVRFNGCSDFSIDLQLEKGEKIIPKKIHTKTDNGYEEFYSEENREVYSTEEQRIGTWIDGKPLYRKAFAKTDSFVTDNIFALSDLNYDYINFRYTVYCGEYRFFSERFKSDSDFILSALNHGARRFELSVSSGWLSTLQRIIVIAEYTKTID